MTSSAPPASPCLALPDLTCTPFPVHTTCSRFRGLLSRFLARPDQDSRATPVRNAVPSCRAATAPARPLFRIAAAPAVATSAEEDAVAPATVAVAAITAAVAVAAVAICSTDPANTVASVPQCASASAVTLTANLRLTSTHAPCKPSMKLMSARRLASRVQLQLSYISSEAASLNRASAMRSPHRLALTPVACLMLSRPCTHLGTRHDCSLANCLRRPKLCTGTTTIGPAGGSAAHVSHVTATPVHAALANTVVAPAATCAVIASAVSVVVAAGGPAATPRRADGAGYSMDKPSAPLSMTQNLLAVDTRPGRWLWRLSAGIK